MHVYIIYLPTYISELFVSAGVFFFFTDSSTRSMRIKRKITARAHIEPIGPAQIEHIHCKSIFLPYRPREFYAIDNSGYKSRLQGAHSLTSSTTV